MYVYLIWHLDYTTDRISTSDCSVHTFFWCLLFNTLRTESTVRYFLSMFLFKAPGAIWSWGYENRGPQTSWGNVCLHSLRSFSFLKYLLVHEKKKEGDFQMRWKSWPYSCIISVPRHIAVSANYLLCHPSPPRIPILFTRSDISMQVHFY